MTVVKPQISVVATSVGYKSEGNMSEYEKLEWLHSQLSELIDGVEVDLEMMQWFVEDLREPYLKEMEAREIV